MNGDTGEKDPYLTWLYHLNFRIMSMDSPESYSIVCSKMHAVVFNDSVPNDDNRSADGILLREEYLKDPRGRKKENIQNAFLIGKATVLEVLIGFSRRADHVVPMGPQGWFMLFLDNLGLTSLSDMVFRPRDTFKADRIIRVFNERKYTRTGKGGLFPLTKPVNDQRNIELWYQMAAYMKENNMY